MGRPKGVIQKRDESKYWLPSGIVMASGQADLYRKDTKLIFIDPVYGEFVSDFKSLQLANDSTHPKAVQQRRESTNIQKYGGTNPSHSKDVRQKASDTMEKKYGVRHALKSDIFLNKCKETSIQRYGTEYPMHSVEVKQKVIDSTIKKYGVSNGGKLSAKYILPNGKNIKEFCRERKVPSSMAYILFRNYGPGQALSWIENYKDKVSALEKEFSHIFPNIQKFQKRAIPNKHYLPDFKITDKIFLDVDGLLWHSEFYKKNNYHFIKRQIFEQNEIEILQFRQDEIIKKPEIVKSMLNSKLNKNIKVFARKLKVKEISQKESEEFLNKTHLMGSSRGASNIALVDNFGKIFSVMSYKIKKKEILEIARFSSELNITVVGGLSKLLTYAIKKTNPKKIESWVDLRYANGKSLIALGFIKEKVVLSWKWTDEYNTFNRLHCKANMDYRGLTEKEYAKEMKLVKIYDAGQALFIKHR